MLLWVMSDKISPFRCLAGKDDDLRNVARWHHPSRGGRHDGSRIKLDFSETVRWLGYKPSYSLASLLSELAAYGDSGPPRLTEA
jgi:hypothetical protein